MPFTLGELSIFFGISAFVLQLLAYGMYAKDIFHSKIRPNVATWGMWFFGGVIELVTYNAIQGAHWSSSALPLACTLGVGTICLAIFMSQIRSSIRKTGLVFLKPARIDYLMATFDLMAGVLWLVGILNAAWANILAVSTSIASFYPICRTTYYDSSHEKPTPWGIWSLSYLAMVLAIALSDGRTEWALYFYPLYYFLLHATVFGLACRTCPVIPDIKSNPI